MLIGDSWSSTPKSYGSPATAAFLQPERPTGTTPPHRGRYAVRPRERPRERFMRGVAAVDRDIEDVAASGDISW